MATERLPLPGLSNAGELQRAIQALHEVWGIQKVEVDPAQGVAIIDYDETAGKAEDFRQALRGAGFGIPDGAVTKDGYGNYGQEVKHGQGM